MGSQALLIYNDARCYYVHTVNIYSMTRRSLYASPRQVLTGRPQKLLTPLQLCVRTFYFIHVTSSYTCSCTHTTHCCCQACVTSLPAWFSVVKGGKIFLSHPVYIYPLNPSHALIDPHQDTGLLAAVASALVLTSDVAVVESNSLGVIAFGLLSLGGRRFLEISSFSFSLAGSDSTGNDNTRCSKASRTALALLPAHGGLKRFYEF